MSDENSRGRGGRYGSDAAGDEFWAQHVADTARRAREAASRPLTPTRPQAAPNPSAGIVQPAGTYLTPHVLAAHATEGPSARAVELLVPQKAGTRVVATVQTRQATTEVEPVPRADAPRTMPSAAPAPSAPAAAQYPPHVKQVTLPQVILSGRKQMPVGTRVVDPAGQPQRLGAPGAKTQLLQVDPATGEPTSMPYVTEEEQARKASEGR